MRHASGQKSRVRDFSNCIETVARVYLHPARSVAARLLLLSRAALSLRSSGSFCVSKAAVASKWGHRR
jgi:hypothetical protein